MSHLFGVPGGVEVVAASALIAGLWQSALLVAGAALLLKLVPKTTPATRFTIWMAVFCVSAALPFAGLLAGPVTSGSGTGGSAVGHLHVDTRWSYWIAGVWLASALLRLVELSVEGWKLHGVWKRAVPVAEEVLAGMDCGHLLAGQTVRVCTSEDVDRPSVIGFFAPRVLVPAWLFDQLSATELRHIVLHELEHLRRRDDWMNLLQKVGLVVFALNPALFWVDRRLAAERELACDDGVLRQTKMPRAYAMCLASIAEMRLERNLHRRVVALALGVLGAAGFVRGRSEFGRRIESILGRRAAGSPVIASAIAAVLVAGVLGAGFELVRVPELVSFAPESRVQELAAGNSATVSVEGMYRDGRVERVAFREPSSALRGAGPRSEEGVRQVSLSLGHRTVPQRLKPHETGSAYGTAEAMPLGKTRYFPADKVVRSGKTGLSAAGQVATPRQGHGRSKVPKARWMVLTSFDEHASARVVVRLKDGRLYVVSYAAAVPVQDGWLLVQL